MISNYIVLALIPCQIWLYFLQSFSLYVYGFICKGWVWDIGEESRFKSWISRFHDWLTSNSWEAIREKATCGAHDWKTKSPARLSFSWLFRKKGQPMKDSRMSLFGKKLCFALPFLYPHYIYLHYPWIVMSAFQRENPRKYTSELEIVIPTIINTFPCSFLQLLPLHL